MSERHVETIALGECRCTEPVEDVLRFELPDDETIEVVSCSACGGLVKRTVPPKQVLEVDAHELQALLHLRGSEYDENPMEKVQWRGGQ